MRNIITFRNLRYNASMQIVYEWEDVFVKELGLSLSDDFSIRYKRPFCNFPSVIEKFTTNKNSFIFLPYENNAGYNKPNIIPCIIDFFVRDKMQIEKFYKSFARNKAVLVSSMEVYDFLKEQNCPLNIQHLGLSLSDKYAITPETSFEKEYDLCMIGRQNSVLKQFVEKYAKQHTNFVYVFQKSSDGKRFDCYTSNGDNLGSLNEREDYLNLMKKTKVALYGTPGIDGGEKRTNGFNQVTPKLLEYLSCGCHVIGRYANNSDTRFYELEKWLSNVKTYDEFETLMDKYLCSKPDMDFYSNYLKKHYTSVRAKQLQDILNNI